MPFIENLARVFEETKAPLNKEQLFQFKKRFQNTIEKKQLELKTVANELVAKCAAEKRQLEMTLVTLEPLFTYIESDISDPNTEKPLPIWCMDCLLSIWNEALEQNKKHLIMIDLAELMKQLLSDEELMAINYYQANQEALDKASSAVKRLMEDYIKQPEPAEEGFKSLQDWQADFEEVLKGQVNSPDAIIPLIIHYYDHPLAFAALLLWLLDHQVSAEIILHSGVLHQFFAGHMGMLESDGQVLLQVYDALKSSDNPEARQLYAMAKTTSACALGPHNKEMQRGFDGYNLTGKSSEQDIKSLNKLSAEEFRYPTAFINPNPENIRMLSFHFSATFLRILANSPDIAKQFTREQWQEYLAQKVYEIGLELTSLPEWFDLYTLLKLHYSDFCRHVYANIIDIAVTNWHQIDMDEELIKKIRHLYDEELLDEKARRLIQPYYELIYVNTSALTQEKYQLIEDAWKNAIPLINMLNRLSKFKLELDHHPKTIYGVQIQVLLEHIQTINTINVEQILDVMASPYSTEQEVQAHEKRLLIEWLSIRSQEVNQDFIIDRLRKLHSAEPLWSQPCGTMNLFVEAAKNGNLSLINRLLSEESNTQDKKTLSSAFKRASNRKHFDVATRILNVKGANSLHSGDINGALHSAIMQENMDGIRYLLELKGEHAVARYFVDDYFVILVAGGSSSDLLKLFLNLNDVYAPDQRTMEKALSYAAENGRLKNVKLLLDFKGESALNPLDALYSALISAAAHRRLQLVQFLLQLEGISWLIKSMIIKQILSLAGHIPGFSIKGCELLLSYVYPDLDEVTQDNFSCLKLLLLENKEEYGVAITQFFAKMFPLLDLEQSIDLFALIKERLESDLDVKINSNEKEWISAFLHHEQSNNEEWKNNLGEVRLLIFNKWLDALIAKNMSSTKRQIISNVFNYRSFSDILGVKHCHSENLHTHSKRFSAVVKHAIRRNKDLDFYRREQIVELLIRIPQLTSHFTKAFNKHKQQLLLNSSANILKRLHDLSTEDLLKELGKVLKVVIQPTTSTCSITTSARGVLNLLNSEEFSELARFISEHTAHDDAEFQSGHFNLNDLKRFSSQSVEDVEAQDDTLFNHSTCSDGQVLFAMDKTLSGLSSSKGTDKEVNLIIARHEFVEAIIYGNTVNKLAALTDFRKSVTEHKGGWLLGARTHFFSTPKSARIFEKALSDNTLLSP